ncbi:MAG: DUF1569 domain-containing protein [Pirellulales bacterium]|nr:DUF1569 domain-containing protein [Pirellulales bacterium]
MATAPHRAADKPVVARRKLHFNSFDEVLAEAERLNAGTYQTLGNWTLPRAVGHLGQAMIGCVDGTPFFVPWWMRLAGRVYFRRRLLREFPSGFKLPRRAEAKLVPQEELSFDEGMQRLRAGLARLAETDHRIPHPLIGKLSVDQWNTFHLRHAELHLSFFVPE